MDNLKPNLFKIATRELTQDSIITWLLQWSNPEAKELSLPLHACGTSFLRLLTDEIPGFNYRNIVSVQAGRQWEDIDVYVEIFMADGCKHLVIIEDKTFSNEHSNQLVKYRDNALRWCEENNFILSCAYIKIGSEPAKVVKSIEEKGYRVFNRNHLIGCLHPFKQINDSVINQFTDYLQDMEEAHQSYDKIIPAAWSDSAWIGFYQFVESMIDINIWHYVNNPGGGFWNLCLTWGYWNDFPVYMQVEQGKLCYKIALGENETELENGTFDNNAVQDFVHRSLMTYALENNMEKLKRPYPFVHRGNYRTIAVVEKTDWLGDERTVINKQKTLDNLQIQIQFYNGFIDNVSTIDYKEAGL